ncbi:starch-binding protein [Bacteroidia bacterium]|nr:starch-binding protein [Bacteroidia bacterium]
MDVVPDKSMTLETVFSVKEEAYNALARAYSYLPHDEKRSSRWLLGDEWINPQTYDSQDATQTEYKAVWIMKGNRQNATEPLLGTWRTGGPNWVAPNLYEGINLCNLVISRVDAVKDMTADEIRDWKAQVLFLKAYYHFLLLQQYGPIIIMDEATSPEADPSELYYSRSKVDDCFNYITKTMKEAIPNLLMQKEGVDLGQVTQLAAQSILAKVLVYRASPFYSGNDDYRNFNDWDGQPFFPQDDAQTTKAKWKEALDAVDAAIALCPSSGVDMYTYDKRMLMEDIPDAAKNPRIQTLYDLRWVVVDPWNKELIWGNSNTRVIPGQFDYLLADAQIKVPAPWTYDGNNNFCYNLLGATYKTLERYYTKNGLPLDDDKNFDREKMYELTNAPDTAVTKEYLGFLVSNMETVQLYLDREPRFYANLGITGGFWRGYGARLPTTFYPGGIGALAGNANRVWAGIGVQKIIHPASRNNNWSQIINYPLPIIRLADLYLMKAEARNQYLDAPDAEVYDAINKVRTRAGIPTVQDAYNNFAKSSSAGKYLNKADMTDIILNERGNEFAFEGQRFWDMLRYRRAVDEFSYPVMGWNWNGTNPEMFFEQRRLQERSFTLRECLWPIPTTEMNKNVKLIQNPGW